MRRSHLKDGVLIANGGHHEREVAIDGLGPGEEARPGVTEHDLGDGRRAYVLVEGRQTNVAGGDGHPVEIMDLSFSVQALAALLLARGGLEPGVHSFPDELDREIARTKLATLGLELGEPTKKQREFEARWSIERQHELTAARLVQQADRAHTRPVIAANAAAEILDAAQGYFWILLAAVVLWRLFPVIRTRFEEDDITYEQGEKKVTLQNASKQLRREVDDVRAQLIALSDRVREPTGEAAEEEVAALPDEIPARPVRVLWVDDRPENNALLIESLKSRDADVVEAVSTDEALAELSSDRRGFEIVISDMGREEPNGYNPEAGVDLVRRMREANMAIPVVIYASKGAITRGGRAALEAGAAAATASPTELLAMLRVGPTTAFEASVADIVRRHLNAAPFPIRRTVDFVAERDGERIGVEIKNWAQQPPRDGFEHALELVGAARERYGFDRILLITRPGIEVPAGVDLPPWITVQTVDEFVASATN